MACASTLNSSVWSSTTWKRSLWWKPIAPRSRCWARSAPSVRFSPSLMLGPQGEAAVVTYGDQIRVVQDLTQDSDKLESALRGIEARGSSAHLNDALARAVALLETQPKDNRRVIVAFSDGHDLGSETHKEEVVQRAVNAGITIYGLGFSPGRALLARQPKAPPPDPLDANVARPLPPGTGAHSRERGEQL